MPKTYGPFASGAGASFSEGQWQTLWSAYRTGVLWGTRNSMVVFADSTGMQVKVQAGTAVVQGFIFDDDVQETLAITAASPSNPRIDRLVLRRDFSAKTVDYAVKAGTPSGTPSPPALQRDAVIWELSLAQVFVAANAITIASGAVADERMNPEVGGLIEYRVAAIICNSTTRPSTGVQSGTLIFEIDTQLLRFWNGAAWITVPTGTGGTFLNSTITSPVINGTVTGAGTYTTPTLDRPVIGDFSSAQHAHTAPTTGSVLDHNNLTNRGSFAHANLDSHVSGTAGVHGISGSVVGTSDAQVLSSKTLVDPLIAGQHAEGLGSIYQTGTINLPVPAGRELHRHYKAWGGPLTFQCPGGAGVCPPGGQQVIASFTIQYGDSVTLWSDGTYWWTL